MNKILQLPQRIFHFFANANAVAFAYGRVYDYIDATTRKALEMLKTLYIYIVLILKELNEKLLLA
jgi:hypothetical protein